MVNHNVCGKTNDLSRAKLCATLHRNAGAVMCQLGRYYGQGRLLQDVIPMLVLG